MTIRAPLTQAEKAYIEQRQRAGATLAQIAQELQCSRETVRKWWRVQRQGGTPRPRGRPRRGPLSTFPVELRNRAIALKEAHPHWGPAAVKLELAKQLPGREDPWPSDTRLWALFRSACPGALQPRHRQLYPARPPSGVTHPHQRWQMDAKENVPVGSHAVASILEIRDPVGALMIASRAVLTTTGSRWRKLTLRETQDTLRTAFAEWGCPVEIQTDHENVYVGSNEADFPSHFTLWLVGLGIRHVTSRDRRPTDQPHVERNHRTLGDLGWKDVPSDTLDALQTLLDERRHRYNHEFPVEAADCAGQPPLQVYPWAQHSGRPFAPHLEWALFDLSRVDVYLAERFWQRHVNKVGEVKFGGVFYYVGRPYAYTVVSIRFERTTRRWRFESAEGALLAERPVLGLDKADLIGYAPLGEGHAASFQLPLPLVGV